MDIQQSQQAKKYLDLFLRRKVLILSLLLLSLPVGLGDYLKTPKIYMATSLLSYQQQKINPSQNVFHHYPPISPGSRFACKSRAKPILIRLIALLRDLGLAAFQITFDQDHLTLIALGIQDQDPLGQEIGLESLVQEFLRIPVDNPLNKNIRPVRKI